MFMLVWMVSVDTLQFVMQVLLVRFAYPRISSFKKLILLGFVRDWCRCRYLPDCFVSSVSRCELFKLSIVSDVLLSVIYQFHIIFHHGPQCGRTDQISLDNLCPTKICGRLSAWLRLTSESSRVQLCLRSWEIKLKLSHKRKCLNFHEMLSKKTHLQLEAQEDRNTHSAIGYVQQPIGKQEFRSATWVFMFKAQQTERLYRSCHNKVQLSTKPTRQLMRFVWRTIQFNSILHSTFMQLQFKLQFTLIILDL